MHKDETQLINYMLMPKSWKHNGRNVNNFLLMWHTFNAYILIHHVTPKVLCHVGGFDSIASWLLFL